MKMAIFYLVCADDTEADKLSQILLDKKLVVCTKKIPVESAFSWKGKIHQADEVLMLMESSEEMFEKVEAEVRKVHSHKVFVFFSIPVSKASKGVLEWMKEGLI